MRELLPDDSPEEKSYDEMFKSAFVDLSKPLPPPPIAISIGEHDYRMERHPNVFGTYGNFSSIVGDSKTKKSFFKSLIMAGYIGGNTTHYGSEIASHRNGDKYILDFDTEQSKYHSFRTFDRVQRLVGHKYEFYKPFCLRKFSHHERLEFIEYCLLDKYQHQVGLMSIDGFADLVANTNNIEECNQMVQKLLYWTDVSQCHCIGILHTAHGTTKATGHLGSFLQKKSETVCVLSTDENDRNLTRVHFKYTRGFPIDDFGFRIDGDGLPRTEDLNDKKY